MACFPMFMELNNRPCLVVGGGRVALRKVQVLLDFGAVVRAAAPAICAELRKLAKEPVRTVKTAGEMDAAEKPRLLLYEREFREEDIRDVQLVVAATDDAQLNHHIAELCRAAGIPINAVDQPEDCTFFFPAYVKEGDVVAAFSSSGASPVLTQYLKEREKEILTPQIGEIGDYLGRIRPIVRERIPEEAARSAFYRSLLKQILETGVFPELEDESCIIE